MTTKRLTRQQAINLHCKQCCFDPAEPGTWKAQADACTMKTCPFYPYRPVPRGKGNAEA